MRDIADLPEDIAAIATQANRAAIGNANKIERLVKKYGISFQLDRARLFHFIKAMVEAGVITEEFYWTEALNWEEDLERQLKEAEKNIQAQVAAAMEEQRKQVAAELGKLAVPERKLILPGEG
jgi:hypothetical protein